MPRTPKTPAPTTKQQPEPRRPRRDDAPADTAPHAVEPEPRPGAEDAQAKRDEALLDELTLDPDEWLNPPKGTKPQPSNRAQAKEARTSPEPKWAGVRITVTLEGDAAEVLAKLGVAGDGMKEPPKRVGQLTTDEVREIRRLAKDGYRIVELARRFRVAHCTVANIIAGKTRKEGA